MYNVIKKIIFFLAYIYHRNQNSKVFYYHDLSQKYTDMGTAFNLFKKHISIIRECGYQIVPEITQKKKEVMICFDDGWKGIYEHKDYFAEQKIYPTIFIAVELIGSEGYLTKGQIEELGEIGFKFESHAWSHQDLTSFDERGLVHELKDSKEWLETTFGLPFNSICYPMGRFSNMVYEKSKDAGYSKIYSSILGGYYDKELEGIICRNCAQYSSPFEFNCLLNSTSHFFRNRFIKQQFEH